MAAETIIFNRKLNSERERKMKKFLSLFLITVLVMTFMSACGKEESEKKDRILYTENLSKQIELGKYKGIEIDSSSEDYKKEFDSIVNSDIKNNEFYAKDEKGEIIYTKKTEGTIANGDTANIDYVGKKDGVAFEGGTAQGHDLEIGSGSFIPGFEDGLIGKKIGDTVDLNLTFPKEYQKADLAGKAVVFTVTINYVTTKDPLSPAEFYKVLGFASENKYLEDANKRTAENIIMAKLEETSKIKEYPKKDKDYLFEESKKIIEKNLAGYGYDLKSYLQMMGQTEEQFKTETIKNQIEPMMKTQMILYSILDEIGQKVTKDDITAQANKIAKEYSVSAAQVKEAYGEYQLEYKAVSEKVMDYLYKNAKIK